MAAKIKESCGIEARLIQGRRGEFTVKYNGEIIAEKGYEFPPFPKILQIIAEKQRGEKHGS